MNVEKYTTCDLHLNGEDYDLLTLRKFSNSLGKRLEDEFG